MGLPPSQGYSVSLALPESLGLPSSIGAFFLESTSLVAPAFISVFFSIPFLGGVPVFLTKNLPINSSIHFFRLATASLIQPTSFFAYCSNLRSTDNTLSHNQLETFFTKEVMASAILRAMSTAWSAYFLSWPVILRRNLIRLPSESLRILRAAVAISSVLFKNLMMGLQVPLIALPSTGTKPIMFKAPSPR